MFACGNALKRRIAGAGLSAGTFLPGVRRVERELGQAPRLGPLGSRMLESALLHSCGQRQRPAVRLVIPGPVGRRASYPKNVL